MHPYATDSGERRTVPLVLVALAIGAAWCLNRVLVALAFQVPWWVDAPSVASFYGTLYVLFDKCAWRWDGFRRLGIVKVPVLRGRWIGQVTSSFDEYAATKDVTVEISQTWTGLRVLLRTKDSTSRSLVGSVLAEASIGPVISYEYQNDPTPGAVSAMAIHYGTARLVLTAADKLDGEYYSGRGRQSVGRLSLRRKSENRH